jgi:hypothetical protein
MAERCVKRHCADLVEWETRSPIKASGAIMIIHNA